MCCFSSLAKKMNIFSRDSAELTKADIIITYIFIFSSIYIFIYYSYRYYYLAIEEYNHCNIHNSNKPCIKTEFIHLSVPYIGILNGFFMTFYKLFNLIAIGINYICCCYFCIKNKENINETKIVINKLKNDN